MSEYQSYEFRAIDRPLTPLEMEELRQLSTRAEITPTSFSNEYHYGDFGGDPPELMDRYFDVFTYVSNFGVRELAIRVPRSLLDAELAALYCGRNGMVHRVTERHLVLEFTWYNELGGGWVEDGAVWMPALIGLREELMAGDLRALHIGWLSMIEGHGGDDGFDVEEEGDTLEPPVPAGLLELSEPQKALVEYLEVDASLIEAAAEANPAPMPAAPTSEELAEWLASLPADLKDALLLRVVRDREGPLVAAEMLGRFRKSRAAGQEATAGPPRRTAQELLAARDLLTARKAEEAARSKESESRRIAAQRRKERDKRLDELAAREAEAWREVNALIATRRPNDYDAAVALLVDLRDLALREGRKADAETRIHDLRLQHRNKPSLIARFNNLLGPG